MKPVVTFSAPAFMPDHGLTYAIIGARYNGKWIFVYHNARQGYGLPAGHIEQGEDPETTARRELAEETGAKSFSLTCVATYTVEDGEKAGSGRLYYAEVSSIGEIIDRDEIGNILLSESIPQGVSFPAIQNEMFAKLNEFIGQINSR